MKRRVLTILTGVGIIVMQFSCSDNFLDNFSDVGNNIESTFSEEFMQNQEQALSQYRQLLDSFDDVTLKASSGKSKRARLDKVYPESYGGAYIDDDGKLVICITDSNENVDAYRHYTSNGNTSLKKVHYSLNTLKGVMDRMNAHVKEHPEGLIAQNMDFFAIDERNNRIVFDVKQLDKGYEEQFRNLIADASCVAFQDELDGFEDLAWNTLNSGDQLQSWSSSKTFSLGIRAKLGDEEGFITTGHADWGDEDYVKYDEVWFAKLVNYQNSGSVDAAFCEITNSNYEISSAAGGSIASEQVNGQVVGYGYVNSPISGKIIDTDASVEVDGVTFQNVTFFELQSGSALSQGDSGGGVFSNNGVLGVIKGRASNNHSIGIYSKATEIESAFGVEIY